MQFDLDEKVEISRVKFPRAKMVYDLNGGKYIFSLNIEEYDTVDNRTGSEFDEDNLVTTFQVRFRPT